MAADTSRLKAAKTTPETSPTADLSSRVTVELLAYAVLVIVGLLRGLSLSAAPFNPTEVSTALRAWQASQGLHPALDGGIPLLFSLQALTFFLAGASDGLARLWPLLAAAALPIVIAGWRGWVGRPVALLTAALVTLSPLANAFARRSDGVTLALFGLALAIAGWAILQDGRERGWPVLAIGAGMALISGSAGLTALIGLLVVMLLTRRHAPAPMPRPGASALVAFLATVLIGGTAFFTRLDGLGLMALSTSDWLSAFSLTPRVWGWGLVRLLLDEPFLIPLGLAALAWSWRRSPVLRALALAAVVACVISILQGPYAAPSRTVAALLFAAPAAALLIWLISRFAASWQQADLALLGALLVIVIVLIVYLLISYTLTPESGLLIRALGALAVGVLLTALFGVYAGWREVLGLAAFVVVAALAVFNVSTAWAVAFDRETPRYAALYPTDASAGVSDLVDSIGDLSEQQRGERWALPVTLVSGSAADELLQWSLRRLPQVILADSVNADSAPPLVITPADRDVPLRERYAGQNFSVLASWDPATADALTFLRWALFRTGPYALPVESVTLWADADALRLTQN